MKKNKRIYIFGAIAVVFWILGMTALAMGTIGSDEIGKTGELICKICGGFGIMLSMLFIVYVLRFIKHDKKVAIEEKDERNIAIRGKAAEMTVLASIMLQFTATIVCLVIEMLTAALLIAGIMFASSLIQISFFVYYSKKM